MTLDTALREHRVMWTHIAIKIYLSKRVLDIGTLKTKYFNKNNYHHIRCNCFLCEITPKDKHGILNDCTMCPVQWPTQGITGAKYCTETGSLFYQAMNSYSWKGQYKLCLQIAKLKER